MKRGYYVFFGSYSDGVLKKVDMQMRELGKYSHISLVLIRQRKRTFIQKAAASLPWAGNGYEYEKAISEIVDPDYIYLRRISADREYVGFMRSIKQRYPECRIIVEIPTYPYFRNSYCGSARMFIRQFPFLIKELLYRQSYKKCIDRFATNADNPTIYGVPATKFINGIDVIAERTASKYRNDVDAVRLISVSSMSNFHGYERLIEGISLYKAAGGKRPISFCCVGDGPELGEYKKLVNQYKLQDDVQFVGRQIGASLDKYYDNADIGVGSLGLYKLGLDRVSSLKAREYMAKGLPMIVASDNDSAEMDQFEYCIRFPNDPSPIPIETIIEFYDKVIATRGRARVIDEIREYAMHTVDISVAFKPVINYIMQGP